MLPFIDPSRKTFKFSNPLSGVIYNNNHYLQQCQYETRPEKISSNYSRKNAKSSLGGANFEGITLLNSNQSKVEQHQRRPSYFVKTSSSNINYSMMNTSLMKTEGIGEHK